MDSAFDISTLVNTLCSTVLATDLPVSELRCRALPPTSFTQEACYLPTRRRHDFLGFAKQVCHAVQLFPQNSHLVLCCRRIFLFLSVHNTTNRITLCNNHVGTKSPLGEDIGLRVALNTSRCWHCLGP